MKKGWILLCLVLCVFSGKAEGEIDSADVALDDTSTQVLTDYIAEVDSINSSFEYLRDTVVLGDGLATLIVPPGFKYLNGKQADYVLVNLWGNPPQSGSLGMLFLEQYGPADYSSWAVDISFEEEGYVSDEDAADMDFNELETQMKEESIESSKAREEAGYGKMLFLGWAKQPYYDSANKKLHWAMKFDVGGEDFGLNYNIRMLGRRGYLVLNIIGTVNQLEEIEPYVETILPSVNFNETHTYADFDPEYDKVAAYGIGALVAGKVLAKAGIWVALLKFWKVIAIGAVAAGAAVKKFFFGGSSQS